MVRVEPLGAEDYGRLVDWIDSPEKLLLWGGTLFTYPLTEDQLRAHYEGSESAVDRRRLGASRTAGRSGAWNSTASTASPTRRRFRE
jgi:hypothetical protein